jgi:hypothetical protein
MAKTLRRRQITESVRLVDEDYVLKLEIQNISTLLGIELYCLKDQHEACIYLDKEHCEFLLKHIPEMLARIEELSKETL